MTQIKLSIAFVLAAAAIAPIVAQPVNDFEGHELAGQVDHPHHHHHHHLHRHPILEQPSPESLSGSDTNGLNSLEKQKTLELEDSTLEQQHKTLERENRHLEHKNRRLRHKERYLEHKDHHLEREDRKLEHTKHSLERKDKSLLDKKHRLEGDDDKLDRKRKTLEEEDQTLESKHSSLSHKNNVLRKKNKTLAHKRKALKRKDWKLEQKGEVLANHNKVLANEGDVLAHKGKALKQKGKALEHHDEVLAQDGTALPPKPIVHVEPEVAAREYAEFDDMVERDSDSEDVGSGANTVSHLRSPRMRAHFDHGVRRNGLQFPDPGRRVGPHIPIVPGGPFTGTPYGSRFGFGLETPGFPPRRPYWGHGPVVLPNRNGRFRSNIGTGLGLARGLRPGIVVREYYDESNDMFERDLAEDVEFDARDFDDDVYLD